MDEPGPSGSDPPIAKRIKLNNDQDQQADDAIAAVKVGQTGDIFKLDIDCYEEAFDYMPLGDLVNVGKTCQRLQQVAGYCFQQNYAGEATCDGNGIRSYYGPDGQYNLEHFARFIQQLRIEKKDGFQHFFDARSTFHRLKQIHMFNLKKAEMDRLKEVSMGRIEVLRMHNCDSSSLHELLDQCVKLKRLDSTWYTSKFSLPNQKYPTMKYLKLYPALHGSIEGISAFLELNPNIRKFETTSEVLWKYRDAIMAANIKLDDLTIGMRERDVHDETKPIYDSLNELHEHGFYKHLQLKLILKSQEILNQLADVKGLNGMHAHYMGGSFRFSGLKNLEKLRVDNSQHVSDLETLPKNLINLKRIYFGWASIDDVIPFIRRSIEMQKIEVNRCGEVPIEENIEIIDLFALNREREKLPEAHKITLYVKEKIYLATKWAMKETDFKLIRLKRKWIFD